jgi:hypothetical protein
VSGDKTSPGGWSGALLVAVACCLAAPALAGMLGGAVLWGVGLPLALALAVALAGSCYALRTALRWRRRSAP